ncbi:class I SAM-dependent methyltransferase [Acidiphilium sp.]|uniref:class I SAM-dependent methyltransferase n=1 Tax=Acidiphilium sp. TaxID=527 RepID=UPI003D0586D3
MTKMPHRFGRSGFGADPARYASARPPYPDALYLRLIDRCGLGPDCTILEIGPGTGHATTALIAHGAARLHVIEPDARLAAHLRLTIDHPGLTIDNTAFETATLPAGSFDLGVAATSFHWINQTSGLRKILASLKPGGWWAMWWTHFGSGTTDAFQAAIGHLFTNDERRSAASPRQYQSAALPQGYHGAALPQRRPPFDLDRTARLRDLSAAGFIEPAADVWEQSHHYVTPQLVDLYATVSTVQAMAEPQRQVFLANIARIAEGEFGGSVERRFTTSLYTARRPPHKDYR